MSNRHDSGILATPVTPAREGGLSTFGGVFTPSILTILGVIMYLRFGWVLGNVGLGGTLLIVTLSTSITFLTALSVAQIATDQHIRIGGAYYMISRSLGLESGGAVGIPLYIAQALSVALYTVGFAESLVATFPRLDPRAVGLVTTVLVALLALKSARAAIKAQYFIMAAIVLSLVSLVLGGPVEAGETVVATTTAGPPVGFWTVFAVFFPAVTGIMAGIGMSGDLRDPARSIPKGTLAAVGVGYAIYMGLPILLATRASSEQLIADPLIMRRMAWWGDAILLGVWGATLSSAVGSILGAPRVLQALARDGILPRRLQWLGRGSGPDDEPRAGTAVTLGLALVAVYFGNLDLIAPVLTMFFLTTYGVLNVTAGLERFLGSPSFRPTFAVHWSLSLIGAVGCIAVMLLINAAATVIAGCFVIAIYFWLERREIQAAWGDVRQGMWMAITRAGLLKLSSNLDSKNWRPHLLVLSGAPTRRWHLIELADALSHGRGLITVATVLPTDSVSPDRQYSMESTIREYLLDRGVQSLVRVLTAPDPFTGAEQLINAYGLGSVTPNTIVVGDSEDDEYRQEFCSMIRQFHASRRNVVIVRESADGFARRGRIDVWWGGLQNNGSLMMILAFLLSTSLYWSRATVVVKMVVTNDGAAEGANSNLQSILKRSRIKAEAEIVVSEGRPFDEILLESSRNADLVLLGLAEPDDDFVPYYENLQRRVRDLPTTLFVLAAEDVSFGEVLLERNA